MYLVGPAQQASHLRAVGSNAESYEYICDMWRFADAWNPGALHKLRIELENLSKPLFFECVYDCVRALLLLLQDDSDLFNELGGLYLTRSITALIDADQILPDELVVYRHKFVHAELPSAEYTSRMLLRFVELLKRTRVVHERCEGPDIWQNLQLAFIGRPRDDGLWEHTSLSARREALSWLENNECDLKQALINLLIDRLHALIAAGHPCLVTLLSHLDSLEYCKIHPSLKNEIPTITQKLLHTPCALTTTFEVAIGKEEYFHTVGFNLVINMKTLQLEV